MWFKVAFEQKARKEFLQLDEKALNLVSKKILDLQSGKFAKDKPLSGKHKGKFRKRAGNYRIIYLREQKYLLIVIIRLSHRKDIY